MDEHQQAHDDLEHFRIERLLVCQSGIRVGRVTVLTWTERPHENSVAIEEPYREEDDLHESDQQRIVEVEAMGETTKHWDSQHAQQGKETEASEESQEPVGQLSVTGCCWVCQRGLPVLEADQKQKRRNKGGLHGERPNNFIR